MNSLSWMQMVTRLPEKIDLHLHSSCSSDGEFTPDELVALAASAQLEWISLTDHNSVDGIASLIRAATPTGIQCLPGIEIDCRYDDTDLHVLGYAINWESADFQSLGSEWRKKEDEAFPYMVKLLNACGFDADITDMMIFRGSRPPSGELIGEYMLSREIFAEHPLLAPYRNKGPRSDNPFLNFYRDYFAQGRPAYVRIDYMPYTEVIDLIRSNGGIPVIAHPGANLAGREYLVEVLVNLGAEGAEVFNNYHSAEQIAYFGDTGMRNGWLLTCGSDFHGRNKPAISLGRFATDERFAGYVSDGICKRLLEI